MNPTVERVTARIQERSKATRQRYLTKIRSAAADGPQRRRLSCSNLAHAMAASSNI
jgi:phosphogluconate dehydratase